MAETVTTEAPGLETGAEETTLGAITNLEQLTASFVEKVEEGEKIQEESEAEEAETSQADAETDQEDVLLQSTEEESEEESEEVVEEEEEELHLCFVLLVPDTCVYTPHVGCASLDLIAPTVAAFELKSHAAP